MQSKTKTILGICLAVVLVVAVVLVIILTRPTQTTTKISFTSENAEALIMQGFLNGEQVDGKMESVTFSTDSSKNTATTENLNTWTGLEPAFDEEKNNVTISFNIFNQNPDKELNVKLTFAEANENDNYTVTVTAVKDNESNSAGIESGSTITLAANSAPNGKLVTITIIYSVIDDTKDATIKGFDLAVELQSEATTSGDNDGNDDPAPTGPLYTVVDNNSNGVVDAGDNINFGLYPTTIKENNVTIDTSSQDADGYYTGSDGEKYAMVEVTDSNRAYEHNLDYSNGSQVSIGNAYFKVEPIVWVVLDVDAQGNATLWTEKIIGRQDIDNAAYVGNKYQEWLTNEFLNTAFTSYERDILNPISVGSDQDLISIMSLEDMTNTEYGFNSSMFQSDPERRKYATDYAMAQGATISVDQTSGALDYYLCGSYMISNEESTMVYQITTSGRTTDVSYTLSAGVVPTVNIQLDSTTISGAAE